MIKSWIGFGDLDLIFKVTVRLNPPKLSQKVFECMLSHGPLDGMLPNLQAYINWTGLLVIRFWWPWPNFQGHSFMTEIATIDWIWRWGISVFSENTAVFRFWSCLTFLGLDNISLPSVGFLRTACNKACIFLKSADFKDRILELPKWFCSLHELVGKYPLYQLFISNSLTTVSHI